MTARTRRNDNGTKDALSGLFTCRPVKDDPGVDGLAMVSHDGDHAVTSASHHSSTNPDEYSCNICLETISPRSPIWSCRHCFSLFDLSCIQSWSRSDLAAQRASFVPKDDVWSCPHCRSKYEPADVPNEGRCFCGKKHQWELEEEMASNSAASAAWMEAHSCGEICGAELGCGHTCGQRCHAGAHPPCVLTIDASCFCGRHQSRRRCLHARWSCGEVCHAVLACGEHRCESACHEQGRCPPCDKLTRRKCRCGKSSEMVPCQEEKEIRCEAVCGKRLACGRHSCAIICCPGDCGPCPLTLPRPCPCGQEIRPGKECNASMSTDGLSSSAASPVAESSCGRTCNKFLPCGVHHCQRLCGQPCGSCLEQVSTPCRCGQRTKSLACAESQGGWKCDSRCNRLKTCKRHRCRRRCCPGDAGCDACEEECGKNLTCNNHACRLLCHAGPCPPCTSISTVNCACGSASKRVKCGMERIVPPPPCSKPCTRPSTCQHAREDQPSHKCHPLTKPCPTCKLPCGRARSGCEHKCMAPCHDPPPDAGQGASTSIPAPSWPAVADRNKSSASASSPSAASSSSSSTSPYACPPCPIFVGRSCVGGHEIRRMPCSTSSTTPAFTCESKCGQSLKCGLHKCERTCHPLVQLPPASDPSAPSIPSPFAISILSGCKQCTLRCSRVRPADALVRPCPHGPGCGLPCHATPCPPCGASVDVACPCGKSTMLLPCEQYTQLPDAEMKEMTRCTNRCGKIIACGHACTRLCCEGGHEDKTGDEASTPSCMSSRECTKKLHLKCACGSRRLDLPCNDAQRLGKEQFKLELNDQRADAILPMKGRTLVCDESCKPAGQSKPRSDKSKQSTATSVVYNDISNHTTSTTSRSNLPVATDSQVLNKRSRAPSKKPAPASSSSSVLSSTPVTLPVIAPRSLALSLLSRSSLFSWLSSRVALTDRQLRQLVRWLTIIMILILVAFVLYVVLIM